MANAEEGLNGRSRSLPMVARSVAVVSAQKRTFVWTRSKCHRSPTGIPSVFESEHIQAMSSKSRSWSESSSSGDGEDKVLVCHTTWAEETEIA